MRFSKVCALALVAALSLVASDGTQYGAGLNALNAAGDAKPLIGNGFGVDAGIYFDMGSREQGRFRISYDSFGKGSLTDVHGQPLNGKGTAESLGIDFLLPFGARDAKAYAVLGVGLAHGSFEFTSYGYAPGSSVPNSQSKNSDSELGLLLAGGLGFRITPNIGVEFRFEKMTYASETHFLYGGQTVDVGSDHFAIGLQARF